jgi:hypothetical protein
LNGNLNLFIGLCETLIERFLACSISLVEISENINARQSLQAANAAFIKI